MTSQSPLRGKKDFDWLNYPSVILILGETGSGKSVTAHYILESRFHNKGIACSMIAPKRVKKLVPEWLEIHGRQVPSNHAVLVDDAQLTAHSREWWQNVSLDKIMSMSRHRQSTIIYVTQVAGGIDVNIIRRTDVAIFKRPPLLSEYIERSELRKLMDSVDNQYKKLEKENPDAEVQQYSYVISNKPRYEGMVGPTPLPTYWSEELSRW